MPTLRLEVEKAWHFPKKKKLIELGLGRVAKEVGVS
jgi:hypothetical protein